MVGLQSPAQATYWLLQGRILFLIIHLLGVACFAYIVAKRLTPLLRAERDLRFDHPLARLGRVAKYWFGQWKHPRYKSAGIMHILIFAGFILLATRAFSLILGIADTVAMPAIVGHLYDIVKDYATTIVFLCMVVAATRRLVFKPARYAVPPGTSNLGVNPSLTITALAERAMSFIAPAAESAWSDAGGAAAAA